VFRLTRGLPLLALGWGALGPSFEGRCAGSPWPLGMIPTANHIYTSRCEQRCAAHGGAWPCGRSLARYVCFLQGSPSRPRCPKRVNTRVHSPPRRTRGDCQVRGAYTYGMWCPGYALPRPKRFLVVHTFICNGFIPKKPNVTFLMLQFLNARD
jgi:hypothetical protein